jgi:hypothetical protein
MSHFPCAVCYSEFTSEKKVFAGVLLKHALIFLGNLPINMKKAIGKTKSGNTKRAAKGKKPRKSKDVTDLRRQIESLVTRKAVNMVETAIGEADKGHFAAMKYLFEMIGLYPGPSEAEPQGEDSLAKTLLRRLGMPEEATPQAAEVNVPEAALATGVAVE